IGGGPRRLRVRPAHGRARGRGMAARAQGGGGRRRRPGRVGHGAKPGRRPGARVARDPGGARGARVSQSGFPGAGDRRRRPGRVGWKGLPAAETAASTPVDVPVSRRVAVGALALFFALLVGLPIARHVAAHHALAVFDSFYRAGALVFGGGHVVLPLLQAEVVSPGWATTEEFIAGYGAAQAVPGP